MCFVGELSFKHTHTHTEQHLNPKAACLKKRDEEKSYHASLVGGPSPLHPHELTPSLASPTLLSHSHSHTLPITPTSHTPPSCTPSSYPSTPPPNHSSSTPTTTSTNITSSSQEILSHVALNSSAGGPQRLSQYMQPQQHIQQRLPFQSYPSPPPPLAPGDRIPRSNEHDPPMKHRTNSGTVSPTIQKAVKGRCSSGSSIASAKSEKSNSLA